MQRRWRWIGVALVVFAGAVVAAAPVVNGWQAQKTWERSADRLGRQAVLDTDGQARMEVTDYERGLYRSSVTSRVELPAAVVPPALRRALGVSMDGPIEFVLDHTVQHGLRGVTFEGHLRPVGPLARPFERLGGDDGSLRVNGRLGLGEQTFRLRSEALAGPVDAQGDLRLEIAPLALDSRYDNGSGEWDGSLEWSGFTLTEVATDAMLELGSIRLDADLRLIAGQPSRGIWVGDTGLSLEDMTLRPADEPAMSLSRVDLETSSRLTGEDRMEGDIRLDWQGLVAPRAPRMQGAMALEFQRLDPPALLALSQSAAAESTAPVFGPEWRRLLAVLAAEAPRLELSKLRVETADGDGLEGRAKLMVRPVMAERLVNGAGGMALWRALRLDAELAIDSALIEALPAEPRMWAEQARAFGILRRTATDWRVEMSMDEGALRIHGEQPWWSAGG